MAETIHSIMARIEDAEPGSPIAVWRQPDGSLKSQFAGTIEMQRRIEMRPPSLIGVFDRTMNQHEMLAKMGYVKPEKNRVRAAAARKGWDRRRFGVDAPRLGDKA